VKTLSKILLSGLTAAALLTVAGCATESNRAMPVEQVASANVAYSGVRVPIAVGKFDNRSSYMRGIFSDGVDRLGGQAKTFDKVVDESGGKRYYITWIRDCRYSVFVAADRIIKSWRYETSNVKGCYVF
jgi:hypothetical protein